MNEASHITCLEDTIFYDEDVERLRVLIVGKKVDLNFRNNSGQTPLTYCLQRYKDALVDKIHFLLNNGANPNLANSQGVFPIQLASTHQVLQMLLHAGAKVNVSMHQIVSTGCPRMLELLLKSGMRTTKNSPNNMYRLLLHIRNVEQLRILERHTPVRISRELLIAHIGRFEKVRHIMLHAKKLNVVHADASITQ